MLVGIKHKLSRTVACEDKSEKSQLVFLDRDGSIWGLVTFGDLKQKMCNFSSSEMLLCFLLLSLLQQQT